MKKLLDQIMKFGLVGIVAFVIDYGVMILLTELLHVDYLLSSGISFVLSVIFNYWMSVRWVFVSHQKMPVQKQFSVFFGLSACGLLLNTFLMWLFVSVFHIWYGAAKILATGVVMVYNFVTRKKFLEGQAA